MRRSAPAPASARSRPHLSAAACVVSSSCEFEDRVFASRFSCGPTSALYGGDALGGVVQMLTLEPRFEGNEWQPDGLLRTMYGSADDSTSSRARCLRE
jgi:hypothetical protein